MGFVFRVGEDKLTGSAVVVNVYPAHFAGELWPSEDIFAGLILKLGVRQSLSPYQMILLAEVSSYTQDAR